MKQPNTQDRVAKHTSVLYTSGEFWDNIPDFCAGQARNKIAHLLSLIDCDLILQVLPDKNLSIVDIACGAGKVSTGLAKVLRQRYPDIAITVHGYDLSPLAIEVANRDNTDAEFVCGDFNDSGKTWDLALLCDIMEHVEDPDSFLRSVAECSRFFVVGFAMDDNLASRMNKRRRELTMQGGHISLFHEKRAQTLADKFGKILASGYIHNPMARNFRIKSVRGLLSLPFRVTLQLVSRRLKGKLFGGESIYFFVESNCFTEGRVK